MTGPALLDWQRLTLVYALISLGLLFAVRALRFYPLYLLKSAWVFFTIMAFAWIVMMSGASSKEFMRHPAGFFGEIAHYPEAFRALYHASGHGLAAALWIPLWAIGGLLPQGSARRRRARVALGLVTLVLAAPVAWLASKYDWSPYHNFGSNYAQAWNVSRMGEYFVNTLLVTASAVALVTIVGSMMAYGLTRMRFKGQRVVFATLVVGLGIPASLLMVPLFLMMKDWSIGGFSFSNSRFGLAVIYAATALPFTTFLLAAFYQSLPGELAKAATVDGASRWQIFTEIYFPLSAPGLATAAIFNFLNIWNEYSFALVFLTNPAYKTLPVGLYNLRLAQQWSANWPPMFAGVAILCFPTFIIFMLLQERIVAGLTVGGVKE